MNAQSQTADTNQPGRVPRAVAWGFWVLGKGAVLLGAALALLWKAFVWIADSQLKLDEADEELQQQLEEEHEAEKQRLRIRHCNSYRHLPLNTHRDDYLDGY